MERNLRLVRNSDNIWGRCTQWGWRNRSAWRHRVQESAALRSGQPISAPSAIWSLGKKHCYHWYPQCHVRITSLSANSAASPTITINICVFIHRLYINMRWSHFLANWRDPICIMHTRCNLTPHLSTNISSISRTVFINLKYHYATLLKTPSKDCKQIRSRAIQISYPFSAPLGAKEISYLRWPPSRSCILIRRFVLV